METTKVSLIAGNYSPSQAEEMLTQLIKNELQFHRFQNFTSLIRFEGNCIQATENIRRLCLAQEEVGHLVATAIQSNQHVHIKANLHVSLVPAPFMERTLAEYPSV